MEQTEAMKAYCDKIGAGVLKVYKDSQDHISDLKVKGAIVKGRTYKGGAWRVQVNIVAQYEYVPMSLRIMMALAEVFGTMDYDIDNWSRRGCETCDYGSQYTKQIEFPYKGAEE